MPLLHGQSNQDEVDRDTNAKHRNESPLLRYAHPDEQVEEQQLKREIDSVATHEANTILFPRFILLTSNPSFYYPPVADCRSATT
jgi:hypothetical protein